MNESDQNPPDPRKSLYSRLVTVLATLLNPQPNDPQAAACRFHKFKQAKELQQAINAIPTIPEPLLLMICSHPQTTAPNFTNDRISLLAAIGERMVIITQNPDTGEIIARQGDLSVVAFVGLAGGPPEGLITIARNHGLEFTDYHRHWQLTILPSSSRTTLPRHKQHYQTIEQEIKNI